MVPRIIPDTKKATLLPHVIERVLPRSTVFTDEAYQYVTLGQSHLEECWHKIRRAHEHLNALAAEVSAFLDSEPYAILEQYDREHFKYLFRVKILKAIPEVDWSLMIGDCVHNARSALDYLAWRLAGSDLRDRKTCFPIYLSRADFDSASWRLQRIHPDALLEIRKLQPYTRPNPHVDLLWFLQELDARDKHKLLSMAQATNSGSFRVSVMHRGGVRGDVRTHKGALHDGAIIAEVIFPAGTQEPEVKVEGTFLFHIVFEEGVIGIRPYPVRVYLAKILDAVEDVIRRFERLISENPQWILRG